MLSRSVLNALLPEGAFWQPAAQSDYDLLLEGIAENTEVNYQVLKQLAYIRCPETTPMLDDLELEYGIIPESLATEAERRSRLEAFIYRRAGSGAWDLLQSKLREAGFTDVYVHPNDPAVDPNIFLAQAFNMVCGDLLPGGNDAQCGEPEAICAQVGGELLVNGDLFLSVPNYVNLCGEPLATCDATVQCGDFDGYKAQLQDITYSIPTESGYWPLIFFVGGPAERRWRFLNEAVMNLPLKTDALDISGNGNDGVATDIIYSDKPDMKMHLPLVSDALDDSDFGNDGTATDITWTGGVANFNGTSSKIVSSYTAYQDNRVTTYYAKVKAIEVVDSVIFSEGNTSGTPGNLSVRCLLGGYARLTLISDSNSVIIGVTTTAKIFDNNIHHFLLEIGNGSYKIIIDNVIDKQGTYTYQVTTLNVLSLGVRKMIIDSSYLSGTLSNFYIFNRTLTDAERTALYTNNTFLPLDKAVANFNGTSSFIQADGYTNLLGYEIVFRFKRNGLPVATEYCLLNHQDSSNRQYIYVSPSGSLGFRLASSGSLSGFYVTSSNLCDNTYHTISLKIIDPTHIQWVIDNVAETIQTLSVAIIDLTTPTLYLGAETSSAYLTGTMSNLYIFDRALTDAERTALYTDNAQTGGDGELTNIDFYTLPIERRLEFRRTILKFKPMHSWGGLIVVYN